MAKMTGAEKAAFKKRMAAGRAAKQSTEIIVRSQPTTKHVPATTKRTVTYLAPPPPPPAPHKPVSMARRVSSAAVIAAVEEKQILVNLGMAGVIGYLDQEGWLQDLPTSETVPVGQKGTLAVLAYGSAKWLVKDPELKKYLYSLATMAGGISVYELAKGWTAKRQMEKLTGGGDKESGGADI